MLPKEEICELSPTQTNRDPEDGISEEVSRILLRQRGGGWEEIWRLVFPDDDEIPQDGK
jgi:hypothetical protein